MSLESIIIVFGAAVLELWLAIPLGIIMGLNPVVTAIVSALGAIAAAVLVTIPGEAIRNRLLKWKYGDEDALKQSRLYDMWNKYGVVGLGLLSPLLLGAPLGAAMGIALGAEKNRLIIWMSIGIIIWSVGLTAAGTLGIITMESMIKPD